MTAVAAAAAAAPPSLEGPGRRVPAGALCRLGFRATTRSRNARATAAAADDESASAGDRCSLHRNDPGCVVGAHRQYLLAGVAAALEHGGGEGEELMAGGVKPVERFASVGDQLGDGTDRPVTRIIEVA
nr:unnamed protein product [Digitaria exilis]